MPLVGVLRLHASDDTARGVLVEIMHLRSLGQLSLDAFRRLD